MGSLKRTIQNSKGVAIIQVLIAGAMLIGIMLAVNSFITNQFVHQKAIEQKTELGELKSNLDRKLSDTSICSFQFSAQNGGPFTFSRTGVTDSNPSSTVLTLGQVYSTNSVGAVLARGGQHLPGSRTGIEIESITLSNIVLSRAPDEFKATLNVAPLNSSLVRPLKSVQSTLYLLADAGGVITSCSSTNSNLQGQILSTETCTAVTPQANEFCNYPVSSSQYKMILFQSSCSSQNSNDYAATEISFLDGGGNVLLTTMACQLMGVSSSETNHVINSLSLPVPNNAAELRVRVRRPSGGGQAEVRSSFLQ